MLGWHIKRWKQNLQVTFCSSFIESSLSSHRTHTRLSISFFITFSHQVSEGKLWNHLSAVAHTCVTSHSGKHTAVIPLATPFSRRSPLWGTSNQPGNCIGNVSETSRAHRTNEVKNKADNCVRFSSWNEKTKSLSWLPLQRNPSLDLIFVSSYKGWRHRQVVFKRKAFEIKWLPRISLHPWLMETFLPSLP